MTDKNRDLAVSCYIQKKCPRLAPKTIKTLNFRLRRGPFIYDTEEESNYGCLITSHRKQPYLLRPSIYTKDFDFYEWYLRQMAHDSDNPTYAHIFCNNKHSKFIVHSTKLGLLEYTNYIETGLNKYSSKLNSPIYCNVFLEIAKKC